MNVERLERILVDHGAWLDGRGGKRADLSHADLRGADLNHADLRHANLSWADLRGAVLHDADLRHADLRGADLRGADLHDADLSRADLSHANLRGADLNCTDLSRANLGGANLDYSAWPLWCKSLNVKIDERIAAQLVYHAVRACQSVDDDDGVKAFCHDPIVVELANRFHRAEECGFITEERL